MTILPCISQTGYPKEVVLNKDTLVAFTYNQVREINKGLEEGEGCKVELKQYEVLTLEYDSLIKEGSSLVINLRSQIEEKNNIINYKGEIISMQEDQLQKAERKKKVNKTIFGTILSAVSVALVTFMVYTIAK